MPPQLMMGSLEQVGIDENRQLASSPQGGGRDISKGIRGVYGSEDALQVPLAETPVSYSNAQGGHVMLAQNTVAQTPNATGRTPTQPADADPSQIQEVVSDGAAPLRKRAKRTDRRLSSHRRRAGVLRGHNDHASAASGSGIAISKFGNVFVSPTFGASALGQFLRGPKTRLPPTLTVFISGPSQAACWNLRVLIG